jgi:uncharacterized membrane protein
MPDMDISILVRCLLFLIAVCGFWFGLYLVIRAYKKTIERVAYLLGFTFILASGIILLVMTTDIFY